MENFIVIDSDTDNGYQTPVDQPTNNRTAPAAPRHLRDMRLLQRLNTQEPSFRHFNVEAVVFYRVNATMLGAVSRDSLGWAVRLDQNIAFADQLMQRVKPVCTFLHGLRKADALEPHGRSLCREWLAAKETLRRRTFKLRTGFMCARINATLMDIHTRLVALCADIDMNVVPDAIERLRVRNAHA